MQGWSVQSLIFSNFVDAEWTDVKCFMECDWSASMFQPLWLAEGFVTGYDHLLKIGLCIHIRKIFQSIYNQSKCACCTLKYLFETTRSYNISSGRIRESWLVMDLINYVTVVMLPRSLNKWEISEDAWEPQLGNEGGPF